MTMSYAKTKKQVNKDIFHSVPPPQTCSHLGGLRVWWPGERVQDHVRLRSVGEGRQWRDLQRLRHSHPQLQNGGQGGHHFQDQVSVWVHPHWI